MENEEKTYEDYFNEFEKRYTRLNPFQLSINTAKVNENRYLFIALCAMMFAGMRTGYGLYQSSFQEFQTAWLAFPMAVVGVIAIEGLLWYYGYDRPRTLNPEGIDKFLQKYAVVTAFSIGMVISVLAGTKFSLNFIETIVDWLSWVTVSVDYLLSITTAVGFTFILFGLTDFIGDMRWKQANLPALEKQKYHRDMKQAWEDDRLSQLATGEEQIQQQILDANMRHSTQGIRKKWSNRNASDTPQAQNAYNKDTESVRRNKPSPKYNAAMELLRSGLDTEAFTLDTVSPKAISNRVEEMDNGIDECSPGTVSQARDDLRQIMNMENLQ